MEFRCTKIDVSHHSYIEAETHRPGAEGVFPVRLPHHYVFLIAGSEDRPSIGFFAQGTPSP